MRVNNTLILGVAVLIMTAVSWAEIITTTGSDSFGTSSFYSAGVWSDGLAPSAGNDYVVDDADRLRTPADGGSYTFAGDSLTITALGTGVDAYIAGLSYKGTGSSGDITINNLILNGGSVNHLNGPPDIFNLYGNISVVADSFMYAKQGTMNIWADVHGSSAIINPGSDIPGCMLIFRSAGNTFTGDIVNNGRLALALGSVMNFVIGANGVNNSISGYGTETWLDGQVVFDLSSAGTTIGDSWDVATIPSRTFSGTFSVAGFANQGDGTWYRDNGTAEYLFDTASGTLSVIPEPSTLGLLCVFGVGIRFTRRYFRG